MLAATAKAYEDVEWMDRIIERPTIWGLETLAAEAVIVRLVAKTMPGERWSVERELRARIQDAFKAEGIALPPMNTIIFDGPNGGRTVEPRRGVDDREPRVED